MRPLLLWPLLLRPLLLKPKLQQLRQPRRCWLRLLFLQPLLLRPLSLPRSLFLQPLSPQLSPATAVPSR